MMVRCGPDYLLHTSSIQRIERCGNGAHTLSHQWLVDPLGVRYTQENISCELRSGTQIEMAIEKILGGSKSSTEYRMGSDSKYCSDQVSCSPIWPPRATIIGMRRGLALLDFLLSFSNLDHGLHGTKHGSRAPVRSRFEQQCLRFGWCKT